MFFLKKKYSNDPQLAEAPENSSQPNPNAENIPQSPQSTQSPQNPSLLGRLSLFQNSRFITGPDTSFENEAWAPEMTNVGLFHKHWSIEEEPISSTSGPQ